MDSQPSLETVLQALHALYHNPDIVGKEKASVWLGELQRSVYAWQIADQLLHLHHDVESQYFAAQTMRTKIQYAFHELPPETHQSLRDSLLDHVSKIGQGTQAVIVTQLCLALADLALQMPSWTGVATDLIQKFGNNEQQISFLLEILTVLPEEISSRSLRLGANRRQEITRDMSASAPLVLQLLTHCLEKDTDGRLQLRVFRCVSSWFNVNALPQQLVMATPLLSAAFMVLANPDTPSALHEAATESICSALYCAEDQESFGKLGRALFQGIIGLPEAYHMSVAKEDVDKSMNYCRIFTEMGETFLDTIARTPNQGLGDLRTLELILTCIGHHQYEVAEITFNFWYRLSEVLYQEDRGELNDCFKPYVQRLIIALCRHCQMDSDHEGLPDENDDFADFRARVSELIKDVVFLVGSSPCFAQMFENLRNQNESTTWDRSEAALFIMSAVAKNVDPNDNEVIPQVLQAILTLPLTAHVAVKYTSTLLVGELSEWIDNHPESLEPVLQYLLSCIRQPKLASVSATAIQNICSMCRDRMTNHFPPLLEIIEAIDSYNVTNDAAVGLLKGAAIILARMSHDRITEGLQKLCTLQAKPLSKILECDGPCHAGSKSDPAVWLDRLAAIFRNTNPSVTNGQVHPCKSVIEEMWPLLSRTCSKYQSDIRVIERCCRCIRFAIRCVGKGSASLLTPLVTQMVSLYQLHQHSCYLYLGSILVDEYGLEQGCVPGLLEMLTAFCGPTFKLLEENSGLRQHPDTVDDLFRLCTRRFPRWNADWIAYTVSHVHIQNVPVIDNFNAQTDTWLFVVYRRKSRSTCQKHLSSLPLGQSSDNFTRVRRFVQRSPVAFLRSPIINPIMCLAVAACHLDHKDANLAVMKFLTELIVCAKDNEDSDDYRERQMAIDVVMRQHGANLVQSMIQASVFSLPSFMLVDVADVLSQVVIYDKLAASEWLEAGLRSLPTEAPGGSKTATPLQITEFHQTVVETDDVKIISNSLREFCRLYR